MSSINPSQIPYYIWKIFPSSIFVNKSQTCNYARLREQEKYEIREHQILKHKTRSDNKIRKTLTNQSRVIKSLIE